MSRPSKYSCKTLNSNLCTQKGSPKTPSPQMTLHENPLILKLLHTFAQHQEPKSIQRLGSLRWPRKKPVARGGMLLSASHEKELVAGSWQALRGWVECSPQQMFQKGTWPVQLQLPTSPYSTSLSSAMLRKWLTLGTEISWRHGVQPLEHLPL